MCLVKFNVRTSKNENSLEIVSDENLNLNNKFIKRGEVNIWKVPTHKGGGGGGGGRGEAKYVRMRTSQIRTNAYKREGV